MLNKISYLSFTYYFPVLMVVYYFAMRGYNFNSIIMYPIIAIIFVKSVSLMMTTKDRGIINLVNLYFTYQLFSIVIYLFNDAPFECYIGSFRDSIFPFLFFYFGYKYSNDYKFNIMYLYGCTFCFVIGLYLFLTLPSYYVDFLMINDDRVGHTEEGMLVIQRFVSFFGGSYSMSFFSIPALILSLAYIFNKDIEIKKWVLFAGSFSSILAAILCQQRISMVFSIFTLCLFLLYVFTVKLNKIALYIPVIVLAVVGLFYFMLEVEQFSFMIESIYDRRDRINFSTAMSSRIGQYTSFDRDSSLSLIFGLGLGSCGHIAHSFGLKSITDGDFIRLFYENGLIGSLIFYSIIVLTLIRLFVKRKYLYAEALIIIFYLSSMIGANPMEYYFFSIMFWYTLGHIWNPVFNKKLIRDMHN